MTSKLCKKCKLEKDIINFSKGSRYKNGIKSQCKDCDKYYKSINKQKEKERNQKYRNINKDKIKEKKKIYYLNNKKSIINKTKEYYNQRIKTDVNYRLSKNLRTRLYCAIKNDQKVGSAVSDLGCSIEEFKIYLESKFQPGMNWDNWTHDGWHIDHIRPISSFDLSDREEFLKACHYTNLQPLWSKDNYEKSDNT